MQSEVTWVQHPVGHGGFHTGVATSPNCRTLRWIFDVGSTSLKTLRDELKSWLSPAPVVIDWLFISHFDNDHVNGLEDLLKLAHVRSVMLPAVNDEAFAHTLCEVVLDRGSSWMMPLIVDPVGWLASRGVERIYILMGGDGDAEPDVPSDPDLRPPEGEGVRPGWKETISPSPEFQFGFGRPESGNGLYVVPPGRCRILLSDGLSQIRFEPHRTILEPWTHAFLIARLCEITGEHHGGFDLRQRLAAAVARKARSSQGRKDIKAAYTLAMGSSNRSSLSLLSVLDDPSNGEVSSVVRRSDMTVAARDGSVAWGSTGDAELLAPADYWAWVNRYHTDLEKLMVLATPHHGSDANSDAAFQNINSDALLTAHVRKGASKHPGQTVATTAGRRLALVTNDKASCVRLESVVTI